MSELRDLENEVAVALLNAIKDQVTDTAQLGSGKWVDLANAYAAVVAAAPGPDPRPTRVSR